MLTIGITGAARSGKDTLATLLNSSDTYKIHRFADPLKRMLEVGLGIPYDTWEDSIAKETPLELIGRSPRYLAQTLGTEWGRELVHESLWVLVAELERQKHERAGRGMIFPDVRFDNEAEYVRGLDNGIVIRVVRSDELRDAVGNPGHASEAGISDELIDVTLYNNGTFDELLDSAQGAIQTWLKQQRELETL